MADQRVGASAVTSYDIRTERPTLLQVMKDMTPGKTPLLTHALMNSRQSTELKVTWPKTTDSALSASTDTDEDENAADGHLEASYIEVTADAPATETLANYHQRSAEQFRLDNRALVSKTYGKRELARLTQIYGNRLKHRMERMLGSKQLPREGSEPQSSRSGAYFCYTQTHVNRGASGTNPTSTSGIPTSAGTTGTTRALTDFSQVQGVIEDVIEEGPGDMPALLVTNRKIKSQLANFMCPSSPAVATQAADYSRSFVQDFTNRGAITIGFTQAGPFELHFSHYMSGGNDGTVFILNPSYWGMSFIDTPFRVKKLDLETFPVDPDNYDGVWAAGTYPVGAIVRHGTSYYRCLVARTSANTANPASDTTGWASYTVTQGRAGDFKPYSITADFALIAYGEESGGMVADVTTPS